jgi:hypothetical protein
MQERAMAKDKVKVPKTVGGLKIPKSLRKSGTVNTLLNNDLGRKILADALIAAAGAAAAALVHRRPTGAQVAHAGEAALDTGQRAMSGTADAVQSAAGTLGSVFTDAVRSIFPSDGTSKKSKSGKKGKKRKNLKAAAGETKGKRSKKRDQAQLTH